LVQLQIGNILIGTIIVTITNRYLFNWYHY